MFVRSALRASILTLLVAGCAMGEGEGDFDVFELGQHEVATTRAAGQLFIEVADAHGRPLSADAVWITVDAGGLRAAECMAADGLDGCETWLASVDTQGVSTREPQVTAFAEVCGLLYLETMVVPEHIDPLELSAHVLVTADDASCWSGQSRRSP